MKTFKVFILLAIIGLCSCNQSEKEFTDILVIGGGLMGSATAWQLSKANQKVLLIEKQDAVYSQGSSLGEARIARSNNRGNDIWSYLHNRSVTESESLIAFLNEGSEKASFQMSDLYTTNPVTYVGRSSIYDRLMASLERQAVDYKIASTPAEGQAVFDVKLPDSVLIQKEYNEYSGTLNPQKLINYLHQAVRKKGNTIKYRHQVNKIERKDGYYEVQVSNLANQEIKLIKAKKVVAAAGPYTGKLLSDIAPYIQELVEPQRVFLAFLKIDSSIYESLNDAQKLKIKEAYPVINSSTGTRDGSFFSMIEYYDDNEHPVFKIGGHFQRSSIDDLDQIWEKALNPEEIMWSLNSTSRYFDLLKLPLKKEQLNYKSGYSCVYSLTSSEVPLVTPIILAGEEADPNFITLCGMSGVGAKGAMTYGLIGAHLLMNENEEGEMYKQVRKALGFERLLSDIKK